MSTIRVDTRFNAERIEQELVFDGPPDLRDSIMREVIHLQDEGVRKALIELGWTPPATGNAPRSLQWWLVKLPGRRELCRRWIMDLTDSTALLTPHQPGETQVAKWYARSDITFVEQTDPPL